MKKFKSVFLAALLLAVAWSPCAKADESEYVLGTDDVVEIMVRNHDDLNRSVTIRPDGKITLPRIGDVLAAGKTAAGLAKQIELQYSAKLKNAPVTVSVKEVHSRRARVLGAVKTAGTYDLKPNWRVMDLIAVAGGLSTKAVRISGRIVRSGRIIPLNMAHASARPDTEANVLLRPDDLIVLDEADISKQITVIGQVEKPGGYDLEEGLTPVSLIAQTGGATQSAALKRAYVLRGNEQIPLDLQSVLIDGQENRQVTGFVFRAGDVLMIPENLSRYGIMGQVVRPGYYRLPEKQSEATILKALAIAGGKAADGDIRNATLTRTSNGQSTVRPVNIEALLKGEPDITLMADDVLYIPQVNNVVSVIGKVNKPGIFNLTDTTSIVSLLGEAGGGLDSAALTQAHVLRNGAQLPVNVKTMMEKGTASPEAINFKLQPGDVLVIPEITGRYAVMGQVRMPGKFYFREDSPATIIDALSSAGGQLSDANLSKAIIVRSKEGQTTVVPVNLSQMMKQGNPSAVLEIKPGDVLFVPQKKQSKLGQILGPLAVLASGL